MILGALHSSANTAPIAAETDNHEKGIVTRAGMRIAWNDDLVAASIDTPAGNQIVLSEDEGAILLEDENGNSVTLNSDGISLESAKDVVISAASGDVKIEGINVEIAAQAEFKAAGAAAGEVSSDGVLTVKGALVKIN